MSDLANPFIGPHPFKFGQKLYGRDWEIRTLHNLLRTKRLVLLHSPSGAGKTSLIQAGLRPQLDASFRVRAPIRVNAVPERAVSSLNRYVYSTLQALEPTGFKDLVGRQLSDYRSTGDANTPELWIFDQFEEVLSLDPTDDAVKRAFFEQLATVLGDPESPRWALFALREDYLGGMEPYLKLLPTGLSARFRLELLDPESAQQAIDGLAKEGGGRFAPDAVEALISDLRQMLIQFADGRIETSHGPVVEPVQLQVVCQWLWHRAAQRGTPVTVVRDDVLATGGEENTADGPTTARVIDLALAGYYAGRLKEIARDDLPGERRIRDWLERQLITDRGLRNQIIRDTKDQSVDDQTLRKLIEAWLVREEPRAGRIWIELSHDRMIRPIQRDNAEWRKLLSPFQQKFEEWQSGGRPADLLLRGAALLRAEAWVREHSDEVTPAEHEYLDKCQQDRDRSELEQGTNLQLFGWGVIFAPGIDPAVRAALAELLEYRQAKAGKLYHVLEYKQGETAAQFLTRHGAPVGLFDPEKVPYYLLIVGGPEVIPFDLQYGLGMNYAVGRLAFDTPEEYARYGRSLIAAETGQVALPPELGVFAPQHPHDIATRKLHEILIKPLLERLGRDEQPARRRAVPKWKTTTALTEAADKARLSQLLGGSETPSLLFLVSHGVSFASGDPQQVLSQGALLCQDWPGSAGKVARDHYLAAEDIGDGARLLGVVAFLYGEFTGGTPDFDDFSFLNADRKRLAPRPFVSRLPQRLLAHPAGGALAIIGHVDRPWITLVEPTSNVVGVLRRLMTGSTVGVAMQAMNQRYTQLAVRLGEELMATRDKDQKEQSQLQMLRTAVIDARNFIVLGDPAARLPIDPDATEPVRPVIRPVHIEAGADAIPSTVVTPVAEGVFTLEIELRRGEGPDRARELGVSPPSYAVTLRWQRPGDTAFAEFGRTGVVFDFAGLEAASGDMPAYGQKLGEMLLGSPGADEADPGRPSADLLAIGRPGAQSLYDTFVQARSLALAVRLPLHIQLSLDVGAPELHALRWEALRDPVEGLPLLVGEQVSFARYMAPPLARFLRRLRPADDIRTLLAVAGRAAGSLELRRSAASEGERARRVLAGVVAAVEPVPDDRVTLESLQRALARGYDILYLTGRVASPTTGYDIFGLTGRVAPRRWSTGVGLLLEGNEGQPQYVSGDSLGRVLGELSRAPALVVLVEPGEGTVAALLRLAWGGLRRLLGSPGGTEAPMATLASIGPTLIRAGIPAVVTVEAPAGGELLDVFLPRLFAELKRDGRIDTAMAAARAAVLPQHPDWWAPVLYTSLPRGRLFRTGPWKPAIISAPLPKDFTPRPGIVDRVLASLTAPGASIVALTGFPGSGASTVARAVLADPRVQRAFPNVRLWVALGPQPDVADGLRSWIAALGGDPGPSASIPQLSAMLPTLLADRRALLVIDDVPKGADLSPFLFSDPECVRLVATRDRTILPDDAAIIEVGSMEPDEAVKMLGAGLEVNIAGPLTGLEPLAQRLGHWPLALQIANGVLRERVMARRQPLRDALAYVHSALDQSGPALADTSGASVSATLEASLQDLPPDGRPRLSELVIFPRGVPVPITAVSLLWKATSGMEPSAATALVNQFATRSLLTLIDDPHGGAEVRLHPVLHAYLASQIAGRLPDLHGKFLDATVPALNDPGAADNLARLTASLDPYLRDHLIDHLVAARRTSILSGMVFGNGLDAGTGDHLRAPARPEDLLWLAVEQFQGLSRNDRQVLDRLAEILASPDLARDAALEDPAEVGWGVVLAAAGDPAIREALRSLIEHRGRRRVRRDPQILIVEPGESVESFLSRNGVSRGRPTFERIPYYLLIAADPRAVPFAFQADLDAEYATGRLHFDTADEYAAYAAHLVGYETVAGASASPEALFWAPEAALDRETSLSANFLVQPLADQFPLPGLDARVLRGSHATRDALLSALSGPNPPALLFTASHGIGDKDTQAGRRARQGALVAAEWVPGQPVLPEHMVTAQNLGADGAAWRPVYPGPSTETGTAESPTRSPLRGHPQVHFAFASFSAGHAGENPGDNRQGPEEARSDSLSFVAELPRRLLALGALAFIGHCRLVSSYPFLDGHRLCPRPSDRCLRASADLAGQGNVCRPRSARPPRQRDLARREPGGRHRIDRIVRGRPDDRGRERGAALDGLAERSLGGLAR
jgi:hypothetical protein